MSESSSDDHQPVAGAAGLPETRPTRSKSQSFSDILTILMRTEPFRDMPLKDLEWLVVPPVASGQYALAHATRDTDQNSANGPESGRSMPPMPVGVVMWAKVSAEVDKKLRDDRKTPVVPLSKQDWTSGVTPWIIVAAGMPQVLKSVIAQTAERAFKGQPVYIRVADGEGFRVETIGAGAGSGTVG